jgi:hypothetical protein
MPLSDLLQSLPGVLLLCLIPGFAVATALAPRWAWWERLAAAPALGVGLAGVIGLIDHDLHVSFSAATFAPVALLAVVAGVIRARRAAGSPRLGPVADRRTVATVTLVALAAGMVAAGALVVTWRNSPLPLERDSPIHGALAVAIAQTKDTLPVIAEPVDQSGWVRARTALEAEAALVSEVGGPAPSSALLPLTLLAVLLLPLAIAALAWEVTGRAPIAAAAALISLLSAFPAWPVSYGELPLVVSTGIVVPLVLAALRGIRGQRTSEALAIAAACVAANWVIHGSEVLTAAVIGGPLVLAALWAERRSGGLVRALGGAAACVGAAVAVSVVTRVPVVPVGVVDPNGGPAGSESIDFGSFVGHQTLSTALDALTGFQPAWQLLAVLAVIGAVTAIRTRTMRWAIVAELAVLALFIDSVSVGVLRSVYVATYPWSTIDRLMDLQVFALAPLAALGVVTLVDVVYERFPRPAWRIAPAALAIIAAGLGVTHSRDIYADVAATRPLVTTADVQALQQMASRVPAGAVVLSNAGDGGLWVSALTPQRLFESWPYLRAHYYDVRIEALGKACSDPSAVDPRLFVGIDLVYVGAREMVGLPHWDAGCIAREPWLRQVASATSGGDSAVVFAVDRQALARGGG